jgi:hypothetical protein
MVTQAPAKKRTVGEWLKELSESTTSTEEDERVMRNLLHKYNFPWAVVTCGIVYLEGHGTAESPPMPIQGIAKMILSSISKAKGG